LILPDNTTAREARRGYTYKPTLHAGKEKETAKSCQKILKHAPKKFTSALPDPSNTRTSILCLWFAPTVCTLCRELSC